MWLIIDGIYVDELVPERLNERLLLNLGKGSLYHGIYFPPIKSMNRIGVGDGVACQSMTTQ